MGVPDRESLSKYIRKRAVSLYTPHQRVEHELNSSSPESAVTIDTEQAEEGMSTREEVEAAEAKMNTAKDALMSYIEREEKTIDLDWHRRLVARLKKAETEFLQAISELGR